MRLQAILICGALFAVLASCTSGGGHDKIGRYLYRDHNLTIHIDSNCQTLRAGVRDRKGVVMQIKEFLPTSSFIEPERLWLCTTCVDDEGYKAIHKLSVRNKEVGQHRRQLYDHFKANYSDIPDVESFVYTLKTDAQTDSAIYHHAVEDGIFEGSLEAFNDYYGF